MKHIQCTGTYSYNILLMPFLTILLRLLLQSRLQSLERSVR